MKFEKCPKCGVEFICRPNEIEHCQCNSVQLTGDELAQISILFKGCLCKGCLIEMKRIGFLQNKKG
jgi:hypothetical protein